MALMQLSLFLLGKHSVTRKLLETHHNEEINLLIAALQPSQKKQCVNKHATNPKASAKRQELLVFSQGFVCS